MAFLILGLFLGRKKRIDLTLNYSRDALIRVVAAAVVVDSSSRSWCGSWIRYWILRHRCIAYISSKFYNNNNNNKRMTY